jgi:hypothetical protein
MVEVETTPKKELIFFCQKKTLFAFQKPHFKEKKFRIFSSLKRVSKYFFFFLDFTNESLTRSLKNPKQQKVHQ